MDEERASIGYSEHTLEHLDIIARLSPLPLHKTQQFYCTVRTLPSYVPKLTIIFRRWMELPTLGSHHDDWNGRYRCLCPLSPPETGFRGTFYTDTHINPLCSCLHSSPKIPSSLQDTVFPLFLLLFHQRVLLVLLSPPVFCIAVPLTHMPINQITILTKSTACPLAGPQCGSPGIIKRVDSC